MSLWNKILRATTRYKYELAVDPKYLEVKASLRHSFAYGVIEDLDVIVEDDNLSEWCRENCTGDHRWSFTVQESYPKHVVKIMSRAGFTTHPYSVKGVFTVAFTKRSDAAMFRLTFNHVANI